MGWAGSTNLALFGELECETGHCEYVLRIEGVEWVVWKRLDYVHEAGGLKSWSCLAVSVTFKKVYGRSEVAS